MGAQRRTRTFVAGSALAVLAGAGLTVLLLTDPFHPIAYLEGSSEARRDIECGTAIAKEASCCIGGHEVDRRTGLPLVASGLMTPEGIAALRGYMNQIEKAHREGRLGSSSVLGKIRTLETALRQFEAGPRWSFRRGAPPIVEPSGRYRIEVLPTFGAADPLHPVFDVALKDGNLGKSHWLAHAESDPLAPPIEVVAAGDWTWLLVRRGTTLAVVDLPRGRTLQEFDRAWPAAKPVTTGEKGR